MQVNVFYNVIGEARITIPDLPSVLTEHDAMELRARLAGALRTIREARAATGTEQER